MLGTKTKMFDDYILFNCQGCKDYECVDKCQKGAGALAFFHGNLMLFKEKCESDCKGIKKGFPKCVFKCKKSKEKNIITIGVPEIKREGAAEGLGVPVFAPRM